MIDKKSHLKKTGKPNIIVLVIDCGRPDHFSCYGYYRNTTPNIDRLAENGILFENAYTVDTASPLSHFALMSGQADWEGRAWLENAGVSGRLWFLWRRVLRRLGLSDYVGGYDHARHSLLSRMNEAGYLTVGLSANQLVSPTTLVPYKGFDYYPEETLLEGLKDDPAVEDALRHYGIADTTANRQAVYLRAAKVMDLAMETIDKNRNSPDQPFFLFMNVMDCHDPYLAHPDYEETFGFEPTSTFNGDMRNRKSLAGKDKREHDRWVYTDDLDAATVDLLRWSYDRCLGYVDSQVGRVVDWLAENNEMDDTVLCILADHAELLGEYQMFSHSLEPSEEQMHIPLIVSGPGFLESGIRQTAPASIVDVRPTIFDLMGESDPFTHRSGRSLLRQADREHLPNFAPYAFASANRQPTLTGERQVGVSEEEQHILEERLRDLGYME